MRVIIVDDEKNIRDSIVRFLGTEGIKGVGADNGIHAKRLLEEEAFDAAVIDLRMPELGGMELLAWIGEAGIRVPVIMISAFGEIRDAVEAMKRGAKDYVVKPFDPEELLIRIRRVVDEMKNEEAVARSRGEDSVDNAFLGRGSAGAAVERLVSKVAVTDSSILLVGESGTGKEVTAKRIHALSPRASGPFVPINIASVPESLLESELFGYEKGAFTGAIARKPGLVELASGGTLFLDEIGDMPLHLQVKLLRFLQERKIQRLGGTRIIPVNVRIIAATNRDLDTLIAEGRFREDLFFRLNVITIRLPALRERREDIEGFVRHFIGKFNRIMGKKIRGISEDGLALLESSSFPGNIRELENRIERAFILTESDILDAVDFDLQGVSGAGAAVKAPVPGTIKRMEREAIIEALERTGWNKTRTSQILGFTRRTLFNKIREYGIEEKPASD